MSIDTGRIEAAVAEILAAIGDDVTRPGIAATPQRVAAAYAEFFAGIGVDPLDHLTEAVDVEPGELGEMVVVRDIRFRSICEHHLLPFLGTATIAYVPRSRIVGLGSLARVVETLAARPQLQERLGEEIAAAIDTGLSPLGVLVVLDAVHQCVTTRGPRQTASSTVTLASRGTLRETGARAEIIAVIGHRDVRRGSS
ncbi:MAG: cyclohydrolase FolE [Microbacteriaceae bacterium]|jgi:GTP cyclohydrolase I|nr:cyclohydrolase FolE [Microbacteriaceae bacterium]